MPNINKINKKGLNDKELVFCEEYLTNGNNMRMAYKRAYELENDKSCDTLGSKMLKKMEVSKYITEKQQEKSQAYGITLETQLKELEEVKRLALVPDADGKLQLGVKIKAIEVQNKMLGLDAPTKMELTGKEGGAIEINSTLTHLIERLQDQD